MLPKPTLLQPIPNCPRILQVDRPLIRNVGFRCCTRCCNFFMKNGFSRHSF